MNQKTVNWFLNENDPRFSDWLYNYLRKKNPIIYNDKSASRQTLLRHLGVFIGMKTDAESAKRVSNIKSAWLSYCRNHDSKNKAQICVYLSQESIKWLDELSKDTSRGKILDQIISEYYDLQKRCVPINRKEIKSLESEVKALKKTINDLKKTITFDKQIHGICISGKDKEIDDLKNTILGLKEKTNTERSTDEIKQNNTDIALKNTIEDPSNHY